MIAFPEMKNGNMKEGLKQQAFTIKEWHAELCQATDSAEAQGTVLPQTLLGNGRTADSTAAAQLIC